MSDYLYYCPDCNKLYKAGTVGKMIKCAQCSRLAVDMNITSEDYYKLSPAQRQELKNSFLQEQEDEDTDLFGLFENSVNDSTPVMPPAQPAVKMPPVQQPGVQKVDVQPAVQKAEASQPAAAQENTEKSESPANVPKKKKSSARSKTGILLKLVSKIGFVLTILGAVIIFFMMGDMVDYETGFTYGFSILILGTGMNLALMGIGEICNLLAGIKQNQEL